MTRRTVAALAALALVVSLAACTTGSPVEPDSGDGPAAGFGPDLDTALYGVGCVAEVASLRPREDDNGGYDMVATGTTRFRVRSVDAGGAYLVAEVEELPEEPGEGAGTLAAGVEQAFRAYQKQLAGARERSTLSSAQDLPDQPSVLSYLVAAAAILEVPVKQRLLEAPDVASRLRDELSLLRRETAVIGRLPSLPAVELTRQPTNHN